MANVTERGKKLAAALGVTDAETCSLIARAAVTYQRLEIEACKAALDICIAYKHIPAQYKACTILQAAIARAEGGAR